MLPLSPPHEQGSDEGERACVRAPAGMCCSGPPRQHLNVPAKKLTLHSSYQMLLYNKRIIINKKKSSPITRKTASPSASRRAHVGRCALLGAERATSGRVGRGRERDTDRQRERRERREKNGCKARLRAQKTLSWSSSCRFFFLFFYFIFPPAF